MRLMRFLTISSLLVTASLSMAQSLTIGDNAPAFKVAGVLKGDKNATLEKGQTYVVEFWATWCGPCIASMPHLSDMADKFKGKINFYSVNTWDYARNASNSPEANDVHVSRVSDWVTKNTDKMRYNVVLDDAKDTISTSWMRAAGRNGIPCAFVVNDEGKIAWIGHPMQMEPVLEKVANKTWDMNAYKAEFAKEAEAAAKQMEQQQKVQSKLGPILKALQAKNYPDAVKEADKVMKADADLKPMVSQYKLMAMVQGKMAGLPDYITSLGKEPFANDAMLLNSIIWMVVENDLGLGSAAYKASVKLGEKMMKLSPTDSMAMDTYALALWRAGEKKKALETQKKAVSIASNSKEIPAETVEEMKDRLKMYGG